MKIGDKVRFLSESGGGIVSGFQGKNVVLVEDEFGFQIPTPINDVVVVATDNYDTANVIKGKVIGTHDASIASNAPMTKQNDINVSHIGNRANSDVKSVHAVEERKGGDKLSCYIAFVPMDIKAVTDTKFECYFINDSNYYIQYSYLIVDGANWTLRSQGEVEPNTKEFIEEFGREALNDLSRVAVQMIAYKRDKAFIMKPAIDMQFRIDSVKFYKLHTFRENDFFEQPALLYPIVEADNIQRSLVVDAKALKDEMYKRNTPADNSADDDTYVRRHENGGKNTNPFIIKHRGDEDILVVDLHIHELLDTTAGMSNSEILNYQLNKFRETLDANSSNKGKKIIFIHGKGNGILRNAIIHDLNYRYKKYIYQDASFQEYGYGATQVTIK